MIDGLLAFVVGFCCCGFIAIMLRPFMWQRALKVALRRLSQQLPLSYEEIEAQRDMLRADFAVRQRALEQELVAARGENTLLQAQMGLMQLELLELKGALAARPDLDLKIALQRHEILGLLAQKERAANRIAQLEKIQAHAFRRLQRARKIARMRLFGAIAVRLGFVTKTAGQSQHEAHMQADVMSHSKDEKQGFDAIETHRALGARDDEEVQSLAHEAQEKAMAAQIRKELAEFARILGRRMDRAPASQALMQARLLAFAALAANYAALREGEDGMVDKLLKEASLGPVSLAVEALPSTGFVEESPRGADHAGGGGGQRPLSFPHHGMLLDLIRQRRAETLRDLAMPF